MIKILQFLFNIPAELLKESEDYYFRFLSPWNRYVAVAVVGSVLCMLIYLYRKEPPRMPVWGKVVSAAVRFLVFMSLIIMLWRPAITFEKILFEKPKLIFVVDKSLSMSIEDMGEENSRYSRDRAVSALLHSPDLAKVVHKFDLGVFSIGETVKESSLQEITDIPLFGKVSKLYEHTADVIGLFKGKMVDSVYVFTDGNSNAGIMNESSFNTFLKEEIPDLPVNIIGVGSSDVPVDVLITEIIAPEHVFINEGLEILCRFEVKGNVSGTITFTLMENGKTVAEKKIPSSPRGVVLFQYKPKKAEDILLVCRAEVIKGEKIIENNEKSQIIKAHEGKLKVLFIEGAPRWEFRYLKTALIRDKIVMLSSLLLSAEGGFRQEGEIPINAFPSEEELQKYDVIIIGKVDASFFSERDFLNILESIEKRGTGIIFIPGNASVAESYISTPLEVLFPVKLIKTESYSVFSESSAVRAFRPELADEAWDHPVMQLANDREMNEEIWNVLPFLYSFIKTGGIKPGKTVLATYPSGLSAGHPVFASGYYGTGKCFFSAVDSTWRWRFQVGDKYFYRFWLNVIRYVSSGRFSGGRKPTLILTGKQMFDIDEQVTIKALIRDINFNPLKKEAVKAVIRRPDGSEKELVLQAVLGGDGYYTGHFYPDKRGVYTILLHNAEGELKEYHKIEARRPKGEFRNVLFDKKKIQKALAGTGGKVYTIHQEDDILISIKNLPGESREETIQTDIEVFNHFILFIVILCGITAEWTLRKLFSLS